MRLPLYFKGLYPPLNPVETGKIDLMQPCADCVGSPADSVVIEIHDESNATGIGSVESG